MNILYIANIRLPTEKAHGIQIMKTCEAFARAGHTVELVVPTRHTPIADDAFTYYGVEKIFKITTLPVPDWVRFGKIGFLSSLLIFSERAHFMPSFWSADIIYSRDALVLAQYTLLGRKFIFESHTKPSGPARLVARRAYRVVVISRALREEYVLAGVQPGKIIVAPDAVDAHLFDGVLARETEREALGLACHEKAVVYTGHLYAHKGAYTLASSAIHLPSVQFYFVGGTEKDIAQFRARWGSEKNIHIIGHVSHAQVPQYLRSADILVIPNSATNQDAKLYTSPMKLFEYMASGTPIVAADVPSIKEILTDKDATFFTPDDVHSLAEAIAAVFSNEKTAQEKAQNARQKAKRYTWDKRVEDIGVVLRNTF